MTLSPANGAPADGAPQRIYVAETPADARAIATHLKVGIDDANRLVVALEPGVRAILKNAGIASIDTLPFFDNAAHANLLSASTALDLMVEREIRFPTMAGLEDILQRSASSFIGTRVVLMLKAIEVLEGIRRVYPASTYCFCTPVRKDRAPDSVFIQSDEGFLMTLGPAFCRCHGLAVEMIPSFMPVDDDPQPSSRPAAWPKALLDRIIGEAYLLACRIQSRFSTVLMTTSTSVQVMDKLAHSIQVRCPQTRPLRLTRGRRGRKRELWEVFRWMAHAALRRAPQKRISEISQDTIKDALTRSGESQLVEEFRQSASTFVEQFGARFQYRGVSFTDQVRASIMHGLVFHLLDMHRITRAQTIILARLRPALVLSWASAESYHILGHVAAKAGVPAMVVPMKTLVSRQDQLEDLGQRSVGKDMIADCYPFAAVQTPMAQSYLERAGYKGQLVLTGPLIRASVDEQERHRQRAHFLEQVGCPGKIVVYAPSMKRVHPYYVVQTLDEVLSSMSDLAQIASQQQDLHLILRLHPDGVVTRADVQTLIDLPPNVTISDTGRHLFAGILALADVLVTNVSTTSEEGLLNGVPVILYDKWARYNHLDAPTVGDNAPDTLSPAYYVTSKAALASTLPWVLAHHSHSAALPPALWDRYIFARDLSANFYDVVEWATRRAQPR